VHTGTKKVHGFQDGPYICIPDLAVNLFVLFSQENDLAQRIIVKGMRCKTIFSREKKSCGHWLSHCLFSK
jgi:hypothetical protein